MPGTKGVEYMQCRIERIKQIPTNVYYSKDSQRTGLCKSLSRKTSSKNVIEQGFLLKVLIEANLERIALQPNQGR